jgi:hypothetical protein
MSPRMLLLLLLALLPSLSMMGSRPTSHSSSVMVEAFAPSALLPFPVPPLSPTGARRRRGRMDSSRGGSFGRMGGRRRSPPSSVTTPREPSSGTVPPRAPNATTAVTVSVTPGIGEEGCRLPSPSRINMLPESYQTDMFFGTYASVVGRVILINMVLPLYQFSPSRGVQVFLGSFYAFVGLMQISSIDDSANVYPPLGTWGLWDLPGSKEFHVAWTGAAQILGGGGLVVARLLLTSLFSNSPLGATWTAISRFLSSFSAGGLFLLMLAMLPVDIYMYTHGAKFPRDAHEDNTTPLGPFVFPKSFFWCCCGN